MCRLVVLLDSSPSLAILNSAVTKDIVIEWLNKHDRVDSPVVRLCVCHADDPGSLPGVGQTYFF